MLSKDDKTYRSILPRTRGMSSREAFYAWMKFASLPKARIYLKEQKGIYNKKTGEAYSNFGVRHAACRFIATNHEEAKPVLLKSWSAQGYEISLGEWQEFVVKMAAKYLSSSKSRFLRWLEANAWAEKYDYVYARDYGLEPRNRPEV